MIATRTVDDEDNIVITLCKISEFPAQNNLLITNTLKSGYNFRSFTQTVINKKKGRMDTLLNTFTNPTLQTAILPNHRTDQLVMKHPNRDVSLPRNDW